MGNVHISVSIFPSDPAFVLQLIVSVVVAVVVGLSALMFFYFFIVIF